MVSGSATDLTRRQLARVRGARPVHLVRLVVAADGEPGPRRHDRGPATRCSPEPLPGEVVLLASALTTPTCSPSTAPAPACAAVPGPRHPPSAGAAAQVDGLYLTGGDVAAAVTALGADGFAVEAEVLPLAVAGHLVGGPRGAALRDQGRPRRRAGRRSGLAWSGPPCPPAPSGPREPDSDQQSRRGSP